MIFTEARLPGVFIIEIEKIEDQRGFFARAWCQKEFEAHGITTAWVQTNLARSHRRGTLRGLHYQLAPYQEAKLMRCISGAIYDVVVDLRPDSPTFEQWLGVELAADHHKTLYIPEGFAHGYQTLVDDTEVLYQVSQFYTPNAEQGIRWNDPTFEIEWPETVSLIISDKDRSWADYLSK